MSEISQKIWLDRLGLAAACLWIFGGAVFFYVRYSGVFYHANRAAIDRAFDSLLALLGVSG